MGCRPTAKFLTSVHFFDVDHGIDSRLNGIVHCVMMERYTLLGYNMCKAMDCPCLLPQCIQWNKHI